MGRALTIAPPKRDRSAAKAAGLSTLEADALSLYDGNKRPEQIADILSETTGQRVTLRQVLSALRTGARKQEDDDERATRRPSRKFRRKSDLESAAENCRAIPNGKTTPKREQVALPCGATEVRNVEVPVLEWRPWVLPDHTTRNQQ